MPTPEDRAVAARVAAELPAIDIVFDGPPNAQPGRFVEVELADTKAGVRVGTWVEEEPLWRLRIDPAELLETLADLAGSPPAAAPQGLPSTREQLGLMLDAWWSGPVDDADAFIAGWAASIDAARPPAVAAPPASVEPTADVLSLIAAGLIAFEHTRDYVGHEALPAIEGWSWYDWTRRAEEFLAAAGAPVHPRRPAEAVPPPEDVPDNDALADVVGLIFLAHGDVPVPADAWAWQIGGEWRAVAASDLNDWLDPSDLDAGVYADAGMPAHWHLPLASPPASATLRWVDEAGREWTGHTDSNGVVVESSWVGEP